MFVRSSYSLMASLNLGSCASPERGTGFRDSCFAFVRSISALSSNLSSFSITRAKTQFCLGGKEETHQLASALLSLDPFPATSLLHYQSRLSAWQSLC